MNTVFQDLRYAFRTLQRSPGLAAAVILSLGLGIGVNTAIFTLIDAVMLKDLPVEKPEQLVLFYSGGDEGTMVGDGIGQSGSWRYFSYPFYEYLRDHNQVFQSICAFRLGEDRLSVRVEGGSTGRATQKASGHLVSGNYFAVLGVRAILGRVFTDSDDRPGARPVAVMSYGYWKLQLGRDPSVVGKALDLNGTPFTIVGVTPPEFFGERVRRSPDFWLPLTLQPQVMMAKSWLRAPYTYWLDMIARLKPGVPRQQAQAALTVQLRQYLTQEVGTSVNEDLHRQIQESYIDLTPGGTGISLLRIRYSQPLHILMAIVALVLLIACANVANLLLARAAARHREISMRLTLGATRFRLIRQLLTESLLLAGLGGVVGALFAAWGVSILVSRFVGASNPLNPSPDLKVLSFTLSICVLAALFFGLAPAFSVTGVELAPVLKGGFATPARSGRRFGLGKALVSFQIALSLLLLVGAGLLVRTLEKLEGEDLGFNREHVLLVSIDPHLAGYKPAQLGPLYQQLQDRVNVLGGVRSASLAEYSPMSGTSSTSNISIQGYTPRPGADMIVHRNIVGWKYFETAGTPVLLGREIGPQDTPTSPKVAVINETMARDFFGHQNPIGHRFGFSDDPKHSGDYEIVGVAGDAKYSSLRQKPERMVFLPVMQAMDTAPYVAEVEVRTVGDPKGMASEVGAAINEIDKNLPAAGVTTLSEQVDDSLDQERTISELSSFFSLLALTLACVGLYGILAHAVVRRTGEIGIRIAIGARREDILRMVMRETLGLIFVGIAVGIPAALASTRLIASQLFGLTPTDPLTTSVSTLVLLAVALFAGYLPARRAAKVDPMVALRYE